MKEAVKNIWLPLFFCLTGYCLSGQDNILNKEIYLPISQNSIKGHVDVLFEQENISLVFNSGRVDLNRVVRLPLTTITLQELIEKLFYDQDYQLLPSNNRILITFTTKRLKNISIHGTIRDKETGEVLTGASIIELNSYASSFSSESGFYSLSVPIDSNHVRISYLGYQSQLLKNISEKQNDIYLEFDNELTQVVIKESISDNFLLGSGSEKIDMSLTEGFQSPAGGNDLIKSVRVNPGVQSGNEGQTGLYVRGGSHDQNLILFEGVPLYEVSHTAGFSSMFIEESIHNVDFIKNGFPARYGGRLSSVLNVQLKDGNRSNYQGELEAGLPGMKVHLEGPIFNENTTFNVSGRFSYIDKYINQLIGDFVNYTIDLNYNDFVIKAAHNFNPSTKITGSVYTGGDKLELYREINSVNSEESKIRATNNSRLNWGSTVWNLHFSNIVNDKLQMNMNLGGVDYGYSSRGSYTFESTSQMLVSSAEIDVISFSEINDYLANINFNYYLNDKHVLKFGAGWIYHNYNPAVRSNRIIEDGIIEELETETDIIKADELSAYIEDTYDPHPFWQFYAGLHFSGYNVGATRYRNAQPRLSAVFKPNTKDRLTFSYTQMNQYVHLLINPGIGLPSDLWVPSTENIKPEEAHQLSLSYSRKLTESINFSISGYYKTMSNLLEYRSAIDLIFIVGPDIPPTPIQEDPDWRNRVEVGESKSRGVEFQLQKNSGNWSGWATYVLGKTDRQFDTVNDGNVFPYKHDRRHDINLGVKYKLSENTSITGNWTYGTGNAFSLSLEGFKTPFANLVTSGERNNFRFDPFHHLDFQFNYTKAYSKFGKLSLNVGLYNAYNRRNGFFIYIYNNPLTQNTEARKTSLFPILPNLSISYSF